MNAMTAMTTIRRLFTVSTQKSRADLVEGIHRKAANNMQHILGSVHDEDRNITIPMVEVTLDAKRMGPEVLSLYADVQSGTADDLVKVLNSSSTLDFNKVEATTGSDEHEVIFKVWYNVLSHKITDPTDAVRP